MRSRKEMCFPHECILLRFLELLEACNNCINPEPLDLLYLGFKFLELLFKIKHGTSFLSWFCIVYDTFVAMQQLRYENFIYPPAILNLKSMVGGPLKNL